MDLLEADNVGTSTSAFASVSTAGKFYKVEQVEVYADSHTLEVEPNSYFLTPCKDGYYVRHIRVEKSLAEQTLEDVFERFSEGKSVAEDDELLELAGLAANHFAQQPFDEEAWVEELGEASAKLID